MRYSVYFALFFSLVFTACSSDSSKGAEPADDSASSIQENSSKPSGDKDKDAGRSNGSAKQLTAFVPVLERCKTDSTDTCEYGTLTDDRDSSVYWTVKIGDQWWMAQDLAYKSESGVACYGNDGGFVYARADDLCPAGWHLPTLQEWDILVNALGGYELAGLMLMSNYYGFSAKTNLYADAWGCKSSDHVSYCTSTMDSIAKGFTMDWSREGRVSFQSWEIGYQVAIRCIKSDSSDNSQLYLDGWSWDVPKDARHNPFVKYGSMTDPRDGQVYKTVTIAPQGSGYSKTWMAENLNYADSVQTPSLLGRSWCFDDDPEKCKVGGRLYTWAAAIDTLKYGCGNLDDCELPQLLQGVCPPDWHLPSDKELYKAEGVDLKSPNGWIGNGDGSDVFGFSALPAGYRHSSGRFFHDGLGAHFWFSLGCMHLSAKSDMKKGGYCNADFAQSVRCVKDRETDFAKEDFLNPDIVYDSIVDSRDGKVYKTVTITSYSDHPRVWMAENLNFETDNSYCLYGSAEKCAKYGRLYTWGAAMDSAGTFSTNAKGCGRGLTCSPTYPVRGICPDGWYLPTQEEYTRLYSAVTGGSLSSESGSTLKSQLDWFFVEGSNKSGFSAVPAGKFGVNGYFYTDTAYFWSASEVDLTIASHVGLRDEYRTWMHPDANKGNAFSVRCIKELDPDTVDSDSASTSNPDKADEVIPADPCKTETEDNCEYGVLTDARDGHSYKTVKIGDQVWMVDNLNFETDGSFCLNDSLENCEKFGRLYTWAVVMDSVGLFGTNGKGCGKDTTCSVKFPVRGICPEGWHVPEKDEFFLLIRVVTDTSKGINPALALKSTSGWSEDVNGLDAFGFNASPVGEKDLFGDFSYSTFSQSFWCANESSSGSSAFAGFQGTLDGVVMGSCDKRYAFPIRCIAD